MDTYRRLEHDAPALTWILADARTAHDDRSKQILRYRVRMLGLSATDTAICLGILADAVGYEGRAAA
jgi:hypothetical protein